MSSQPENGDGVVAAAGGGGEPTAAAENNNAAAATTTTQNDVPEKKESSGPGVVVIKLKVRDEMGDDVVRRFVVRASADAGTLLFSLLKETAVLMSLGLDRGSDDDDDEDDGCGGAGGGEKEKIQKRALDREYRARLYYVDDENDGRDTTVIASCDEFVDFLISSQEENDDAGGVPRDRDGQRIITIVAKVTANPTIKLYLSATTMTSIAAAEAGAEDQDAFACCRRINPKVVLSSGDPYLRLKREAISFYNEKSGLMKRGGDATITNGKKLNPANYRVRFHCVDAVGDRVYVDHGEDLVTEIFCQLNRRGNYGGGGGGGGHDSEGWKTSGMAAAVTARIIADVVVVDETSQQAPPPAAAPPVAPGTHAATATRTTTTAAAPLSPGSVPPTTTKATTTGVPVTFQVPVPVPRPNQAPPPMPGTMTSAPPPQHHPHHLPPQSVPGVPPPPRPPAGPVDVPRQTLVSAASATLPPPASSPPTTMSSFRKPFATSDELKKAVDEYLVDSTHASEVARTYGYPIGNWDVSQITNFSRLFDAHRNPRASEFNESLFFWDVSNGADFTYMFRSASKFDADLSAWDVSRAVKMRGMFEHAKNFNGNLSKWNVSNVRDMSFMFCQAESFRSGDLAAWDVSNVTDMSFMFMNAVNFDSNLRYWNILKVTQMKYMFGGLGHFRTPIFSYWDLSNVTDKNKMFSK